MYLITEGPDCAGKDEQAARLVRRMMDEGMNPLLVAEPCSDLPTGKLLRQLLKSGEYVEAHPGLFLADRMALQANIIKPALDAGRPVVSVRSFLSTVCYQAERYPMEWLYAIHSQLTVKPTHVIILDVDPEEGQRRMVADGRIKEIYETTAIQKRVRDRYLDLPEQDRFWESLSVGARAIVVPSPANLGMGPEESKTLVQNTIWDFVSGKKSHD